MSHLFGGTGANRADGTDDSVDSADVLEVTDVTDEGFGCDLVPKPCVAGSIPVGVAFFGPVRRLPIGNLLTGSRGVPSFATDDHLRGGRSGRMGSVVPDFQPERNDDQFVISVFDDGL